jgi:rhamnosyl/mannosyltransferase
MWHSDIVKQKNFLKFYKPFLNMFLKNADVILTTSPNMINNSTFLQAFKHKCKVLHLGIDPTEYILTKTEQNDVDSFKQNKQTKELLFVGRLTYYKGVSILIEAMKDTDAHLTIIGDGYLKEECLTLIEKNKLENKITILPPQTKRELIKWFHKCDIFILPSIAPSEAFGIVQLEAMICKKPVISTNLPTGVPYVNQNGYSGIIVPVGDILALNKAIKELLANEKLMTTYGENGHKRVLSEFTNQKMIENIIKIYSEL